MVFPKDDSKIISPLSKAEFPTRAALYEDLATEHLEHLYRQMLGEPDDVCKRLLASTTTQVSLKSNGKNNLELVPTEANKQSQKSTNETSLRAAKTASPAAENPKRVKQRSNVSVLPSTSPVPSLPPVTSIKKNSLKPHVGVPRRSSSSLADRNSPSGAQIACRFCDKTFTRAMLLKMHYDMTHHAEIRSEEKGNFQRDIAGGKTEVAAIAGDMDQSKITCRSKPSVPSPTKSGQISLLRSKIKASPNSKHLAGSRVNRYTPKSTLSPKPGRAPPPLAGTPAVSCLQKGYNRPSSFALSPATINRNVGGSSKMLMVPDLPGLKRRARAHSSSEEEEECVPKHTNIIRKRVANDSDDEDYKTSAKSVKLGPEGLRTSNRIRTRKSEQKVTKEDEDDEKSVSEDSTKESGTSGDTEESSSTATPTSSLKANLVSHRKGKRGRRSASTLAASCSQEEQEQQESKEPRPPLERTEQCEVEGCGRMFYGYFSMMRHVAFKHRPEKTMALMKLQPVKATEKLQEKES